MVGLCPTQNLVTCTSNMQCTPMVVYGEMYHLSFMMPDKPGMVYWIPKLRKKKSDWCMFCFGVCVKAFIGFRVLYFCFDVGFVLVYL